VVDVAHPPALAAGFSHDAVKPAGLLECGPPYCPAFFAPPYLAAVKEQVVGQHGMLNDAKIDPNYAAWLVKMRFVDQGLFAGLFEYALFY
jgi:hypothetical protein